MTVVTVVSTSRAEDAAMSAAMDVAAVAEELQVEYRILGGNAVRLLTLLHGVADRAPDRATVDADFGAEARVIGDRRLARGLTARGYQQTEGNRFVRAADDRPELAVDLLTPSYTRGLVTGRKVGDLVVDAVPGLHLALARPASVVTAELRTTTGEESRQRLCLPDVVSALCMKAYAYEGRFAARDALDIWRLLEAGLVSGLTAEGWAKGASGVEAAAIIRGHFGGPGSRGPAAATGTSGDQARIRTLVSRLVPVG